MPWTLSRKWIREKRMGLMLAMMAGIAGTTIEISGDQRLVLCCLSA